MSLAKSLAGRKRENQIWNFFKYNDSNNKSVCQAKTPDGKACELQLAGKNPTNLKLSAIVVDQTDTPTLNPALKRFKFLACKIQTSETTAAASAMPTVSSVQSQLENYLAEQQQHPSEEDALTFWKRRHASYSQLADLAEDLIAGPASQAYVECIFSLCGWLTAGRRNRLTKNLEMRVFLKLNAHLLK